MNPPSPTPPPPWAQPPRIAFVGAGRLAQALGTALVASHVPVVAIASRNPDRASTLATQLGCPALPAQAAVDQAELVFLSVADDAIAAVAAALRWRPGQAVVHCSGATEVSTLDPAAQAGAAVGGFHPLQIFSDPARAAQLLAGSSVAIESPQPALQATLTGLAVQLGMRVLRLPAGSRSLYHAAAGYAASGLLPVLQEAVALWQVLGFDEATTLQALLPLARGTLDSVERRGVAGALSGPVSRGDVEVLARQQAALHSLGPEHGNAFDRLVRSQMALAQASGRLDARHLDTLRQALAKPPGAVPQR